MFDPDYTKLGDYLRHELSDLYDAELRWRDQIPKLGEAANSPHLTQAFDQLLGQADERIERLEQVFTLNGSDPERETCKAMQGLIKESEDQVKASGDPVVTDLALIAAAQRIAHYEMAGYGAARTAAETLDKRDLAQQLQRSLDQAKATDAEFTELALTLHQRAA